MAKKKKELEAVERQPEFENQIPKYLIPDKFRETPRRYKLDGKWVGIGGPITMKGVPPKNDVVILEATEKQYLKIAETNSYLVKKL